MKILITGGAGFIGSYLARSYLKEKNEVFIIDNLSTGSLDNIKWIESFVSDRSKLHLEVDDILNDKIIKKLIKETDFTIHLAAAVGVKYILENPLKSITTNITGTEKVLHYCCKYKKRVLIASTSETYGKQSKSSLKETDDVTFGASGKARWSYAVAKLMDEFTALAYNREQNLNVVIARLFNIIGSRQTGDYGMVVPRFIRKALNNEPLVVHGDGSQSRTFTHVEEACKTIKLLIENPLAYGEVVNIGGAEEVTILNLAKKIIRLSGSKSQISFLDYDKVYNSGFEDMARRVPNCEKLMKITNFSPNLKLEEILTDIIKTERSER